MQKTKANACEGIKLKRIITGEAAAARSSNKIWHGKSRARGSKTDRDQYPHEESSCSYKRN